MFFKKQTGRLPVLLTCLLLLLFFWTTLARKTEIEIRFDQDKLTFFEKKTSLVETENTPVQFSSLAVLMEHDKDSLGVLPFYSQKVTLVNTDEQHRTILFSKPTKFDYFKQLKSHLSFNREPFAAKVFYDDTGFITKEEISLRNLPIKKIVLSVWNANEVTLTLKTKEKEGVKLWFRPKFHHDGTLTLNNKVFPFSIPVNNSSLYYVQILSSLLARNLLGAYLIFMTVSLLSKIMSKIITLSNEKTSTNFALLIIICLCLITFISAFFISFNILQKIPHTQDEVAYLFQANNFARGKLFADSARGDLRIFFDHEFIINNGKWFGKYPPLASLFLAGGELIGNPGLINPLISTVNIFLFFVISRSFISQTKSIIAALLLTTSPFFLLISSSFLSHPAALLLFLLGILTLVKIRDHPQKKIFWLILGMSLGALYLIRPANAVVLGLVCGISLYKLVPKYLQFFLLSGITASLFFITTLFYNFALTGNHFVSPLKLYRPYDTIGFGMRGVEADYIFTLEDAFKNLTFNFYSLLDMLFRWPAFLTLSFIPFAFFGRRQKQASYLLAIFLIQITLYFLYFHEGTFYGPRYWFEVAWILPLLTVIGMETLSEKINQKKNQASYSPYVVLIILFIFGLVSTIAVLPQFIGVNNMSAVETPSLNIPAVVFIPSEKFWQQYGMFFIKHYGSLDNPIIFARDQGVYNLKTDLSPLPNENLKSLFPNRHFYHYKDGEYIPI